jgi:hypothetical protein
VAAAADHRLGRFLTAVEDAVVKCESVAIGPARSESTATESTARAVTCISNSPSDSAILSPSNASQNPPRSVDLLDAGVRKTRGVVGGSTDIGLGEPPRGLVLPQSEEAAGPGEVHKVTMLYQEFAIVRSRAICLLRGRSTSHVRCKKSRKSRKCRLGAREGITGACRQATRARGL